MLYIVQILFGNKYEPTTFPLKNISSQQRDSNFSTNWAWNYKFNHCERAKISTNDDHIIMTFGYADGVSQVYRTNPPSIFAFNNEVLSMTSKFGQKNYVHCETIEKECREWLVKHKENILREKIWHGIIYNVAITVKIRDSTNIYLHGRSISMEKATEIFSNKKIRANGRVEITAINNYDTKSISSSIIELNIIDY